MRAGALDANSVASARAIGSVYGPDAEKAFLPVHHRRRGQGPGQAGQGGERPGRLHAGLGAFLASANPQDAGRAYTALRAAAGHMQMIADPLAEAIVKQFPDKFRG